MSEQIQRQKAKHKQEEEPIDGIPESLYNQELDALTKIVLEHCAEVIEE